MHVSHNLLDIVISRNILAVRLVVVSILVAPGLYLGAKLHIGSSIPHIIIPVFFQYIDLVNAFHGLLFPPRLH